MEYYIYVILIFAIVLKLTVYLCWYHVRQSSSREVRIVLPDGTTHCAIISDRGRVQQLQNARLTPEERQNLPQADSLIPYENQGMEECAVQPRYADSFNPIMDQYSPLNETLPKYEEVAGMPPPYSAELPELASAVQPVDSSAPSQSLPSPPAYQSHPDHTTTAPDLINEPLPSGLGVSPLPSSSEPGYLEAARITVINSII